MMKMILRFFLPLLLIPASNLFSQTEIPLQPTKESALLNVLVTDSREIPSEGEFVIFKDKQTGKEFSGITGPNGKFSILIPKNRNYEVKCKSFEGSDQLQSLEIPETDGLLTFDYTIVFQLPKVYTLENVYFDIGKNTLRGDSYKALDNLAEVMILKKKMRIEIGGHTDDIGSAEVNHKLSHARAESVRDYLIRKGVEPARVEAVGYGPSRPVASNETPEGRQKNRRTEVRILE